MPSHRLYDHWAATRTHSHRDAPVELAGGPLPVLFHSPGHLMSRAFGALLAEEFASHGYAVVSLDHTHDPTEVEFPGGRIEVNRQADPESFETFKRDNRLLNAHPPRPTPRSASRPDSSLAPFPLLSPRERFGVL